MDQQTIIYQDSSIILTELTENINKSTTSLENNTNKSIRNKFMEFLGMNIKSFPTQLCLILFHILFLVSTVTLLFIFFDRVNIITLFLILLFAISCLLYQIIPDIFYQYEQNKKYEFQEECFMIQLTLLIVIPISVVMFN